MSWLGQLMRTLLPRPCPGCQRQLGAQAGLCPGCREALRPQVERHSLLRVQAEPHLVSLGRYTGPTRRAIRALKFGGASELAEVLGGALATGVPAAWGLGSVVPVPLHPARERERGFNQSALLADVMARQLGVPMVRGVRRIRATRQQASLPAHERATNLAGAFEALPQCLPPGAVLLVDDVLTTGNTLEACRDALVAAGVPERTIFYAVLAR